MPPGSNIAVTIASTVAIAKLRDDKKIAILTINGVAIRHVTEYFRQTFLLPIEQRSMKTHLLAVTLIALAVSSVFAQQQTGITITKIEYMFEKTPVYGVGVGPKRNAGASKDWLVVEVEFSYEQKGPGDPPFLDDLTFNYYIALNNKSQSNPQETLLTGSVTHVAVPAGKGMRSVMFVSPRTLERFFGGKSPANANQAVAAVGVTITRAGQVVAEQSVGAGKNSPQWWTRFQQAPPGYVLNKNETPFAPLFGDYYEAIRAKPPGL